MWVVFHDGSFDLGATEPVGYRIVERPDDDVAPLTCLAGPSYCSREAEFDTEAEARAYVRLAEAQS